jgi:hypothetical protein
MTVDAGCCASGRKSDTFAERIAGREQLECQRLRQDDDPFATLSIVRVDRTAGKEADAERVQVSCADTRGVRLDERRVPLECDARVAINEVERDAVRHAHRRDPRRL